MKSGRDVTVEAMLSSVGRDGEFEGKMEKMEHGDSFCFPETVLSVFPHHAFPKEERDLCTGFGSEVVVTVREHSVAHRLQTWPGWMGIWSSWSSASCPCPWKGDGTG